MPYKEESIRELWMANAQLLRSQYPNRLYNFWVPLFPLGIAWVSGKVSQDFLQINFYPLIAYLGLLIATYRVWILSQRGGEERARWLKLAIVLRSWVDGIGILLLSLGGLILVYGTRSVSNVDPRSSIDFVFLIYLILIILISLCCPVYLRELHKRMLGTVTNEHKTISILMYIITGLGIIPTSLSLGGRGISIVGSILLLLLLPVSICSLYQAIYLGFVGGRYAEI